MGLVNTVVPLAELERETVAWCREMVQLSPLSLRLLKASFNADEDGIAGIQQLSHDATLLFYMTEEGQEGRDAYSAGAQARLLEVPEAPVSGLRLWLMAARPRTLPAAVAPVLVGTAAAVQRVEDLRIGAFVAALVGLGVHPDRHQPRQRLLGRRAGRRHRRPPRPGPCHRGRARHATPRACRHVARVRASRSSRRLPDGGRGAADPAGRRALDPRRRRVHGRAPALRLRRAWARCSSSSSSAWSRSTAPTTCSSRS